MANWLRLRRQTHAPRQQDGTETIYAAADGTLKHMDPEGTVSDLVGEGVLPSPTSEGDVLTVVDGDWAGEAPSGGSQTVKCVDLGVVDASDVAAGATVTLYTPAAGEIVRDVFFDAVTFCDVAAIAVGQASVYESTDAFLTRVPLASWDSDLVRDGIATAQSFHSAIPFQTTPVVAGGCASADSPPALAWQALAAHIPGDSVFAAGTYWTTTDTGDSGGSAPDFAGNTGGSVVDGDITWNDAVATPPTVGSAHVYALVLTPT